MPGAADERKSSVQANGRGGEGGGGLGGKMGGAGDGEGGDNGEGEGGGGEGEGGEGEGGGGDGDGGGSDAIPQETVMLTEAPELMLNQGCPSGQASLPDVTYKRLLNAEEDPICHPL